MELTNWKKLQNGSDIRGVALDTIPGEKVNLTPEIAERIAKGFLLWLMDKTGKRADCLRITLGRDPRLSGSDILNAAAKALQAHGVNVMDCGLASTPAMFMSTMFMDTRAHGAIMITASHLPSNRNGMKFFSRDGGLEKGDITSILEYAASEEALKKLPNAQRKEIEKPDLMGTYAAHLRKLICDGTKIDTKNAKVLKGLKIAVDAGNGSGGFFAKKVLEPLGADISPSRYLNPDGNFPNHQPNPENKEAMASICEAVTESGADLGLIFDTDVDRSSAVDEKGREISRNGIVAMAASLIADKYPGSTVVTDSITSNELGEYLEKNLGLTHLRFKRGYRNVINKSIELNSQGIVSPLAIETSGHAAFKDNYFLDDGAYLAALIVIRTAVLHQSGQKISSVIADLKDPLEAVEVRLKIQAEDFQSCGDQVLANLEEKFTAGSGLPKEAQGLKFQIVTPNYEGIRISISGEVNGWFLLRKSLHDPILPLNIETQEEGGAARIRGILRTMLKEENGVDLSNL